MRSAIEFRKQCVEQGISFNPQLAPYTAALGFGRILSTLLGRNEWLSSGPIPDMSFCTDPVSFGHATLINSTHQRGGEIESPYLRGTRHAFCEKAEGRFAEWLQDLSVGRAAAGDVIVDARGLPVAITKRRRHDIEMSPRYGDPLSLLLQDVIVTSDRPETSQSDGTVVLPRGALVAAEVNYLGGDEEQTTMPPVTSVVPWSAVQSIAFGRMAALGLSDEDWAEYLGVARPRLLQSNRVDEIVAAALQLPQLQEQLYAVLTTIS